MRDLIRQITAAYTSTKLEGQEGGIVVLSGQEPDTQGRVWIKILPRLLGDDPKIAARFRGLAQTIRQLNHPNIASIRAVGERAGLPYMVTRAVEKAQPLAAMLDEPWAVDAAADLVMQVGEALEHAYNKGVIHGSLTPRNILVQENGHVKVTDLGLSALLDLVGVRLKQEHSPYVAPERTIGKAADARSDVYSLASILYTLVAKRAPQVVNGAVLPPGRFNPEVPPDMDRVLVRALAPNPADRYPDVKALLKALGAVALAARVEGAQAVTSTGRCPQCGARDQTGRFCRKCGTPLLQPGMAATTQPGGEEHRKPLQAPSGEVAPVQVTKGLELGQAVVAQPMVAASAELAALFPEPLPMPQLDTEVWKNLEREVELAMPEPPPMPTIDWAEVVPPVPRVADIEGKEHP